MAIELPAPIATAFGDVLLAVPVRNGLPAAGVSVPSALIWNPLTVPLWKFVVYRY
jgi:hypothetical protein